MSVEFVDTNVILYAYDSGASAKHARALNVMVRLVESLTGALSVQVLAEFYAVATKKLHMTSEAAEEIVRNLGIWTIHRPGHSDLLKASRLHRRYQLSWWDALIVTSALELGCTVLWTEDLTDGQRFGDLTVRNPFQ